MPYKHTILKVTKPIIKGLWAVLFLCAWLTAGLYGQQDFRGSIEGQVKDETGGAIPGATVTVTLVSQDKSHSVVTAENGSYMIPYLEPGTYHLKATMPGFKTYERTEIILQVHDKLTIDIALPVGHLSDEIIVRGDSTPLVQQISNFDQSVEEKQILDLPMNGRNAYLLLGLAAGVLPEGDPSRLRPFDNDSTSDYTVGGTGNRTGEISLDGGTNTTGGGRIVFIPSTEAVKEFKVTTSAFDASVGNSSGSIINASLKSGEKKYHGSLYEFHRNSALDANFWHANRQSIPLPSAKWNQFGGSLGGPLHMPFRPKGKARTFFFLNFEGMRQNRVEAPYIRTTPSALERQGDFSQTYYIDREGNPAQVRIFDPLTTRCTNCDAQGNPPPDPNRPGQRLGRAYQRQQFPGNRIPRSRMDPVALQLLNFIPLPTRAGDPITGQNNFMRNGATIDNYDQLIARLDHNISERQNLFLSLSFSGLDHKNPNWLGNVASPNQQLLDRVTRRLTFGQTYMFGGGLVMDAQYSFARYRDTSRQATIGIDLTSLGFSPQLVEKIRQSFGDRDGSNTAFPDIDINNYVRLGTGGDNVRANIANDSHQTRVNFTKVRGRHALRWGSDYLVVRRNEFNFGLPNGRMSFSKSFTHGPNPNAAQSTAAGNELATFLLGNPTGGYIEQKTTVALQDLYLGAYIQDDFKLGGRLTLNLGLRWEYYFPRTDRFNRMTRGFDYDATNPIEGAVRARIQNIVDNDPRFDPLSNEVKSIVTGVRTRGGLLFAGQNGTPRGQVDPHPLLFAPRFGFAYKLSDKMVARGGVGFYFEPVTRTGNPPQDGFNARTDVIATAPKLLPDGVTVDPSGVTLPAATLANPYDRDLVGPVGSSLGLASRVGQSISFVDPTRSSPRFLRAEFGIQRELPGRIAVNANYLATRWRGRYVDVNINDIPDSYLQRGEDWLNQQVPNPFYCVDPNNPANCVAPRNTTLGRNQTIQLRQLLKPYPQFDYVTTSYNRGRAWYHGLNLNLSRRFDRGYSFQAAYTLSKGLTATSYANTDDQRINHLDRRLLDDDRPQRLVLNGIYELPFGRRKIFFNDGWGSRILGGWQISGIATFMSGRPVHFGDDRNNAVLIWPTAALSDGPYYDKKLGRWMWFNRDAFRTRRTTPVPNTTVPEEKVAELKNIPRNLPNVRSAGINTVDLRLTRNFPVSERVRMQFIAESFNLANRVQYGAPVTDIRNVNFGTTGTQANLPRSFQFALRLQF